jgi:hypothetical protein
MRIIGLNHSKSSNVLSAGLGAALAIASITSCGGGGGAAGMPDPTPTGPTAGTANIAGQLVEGAGGRITSAAGAGLSGVLVQLINTATGALAGSGTTDIQGRYEFRGVPSGKDYLLKMEFAASRDLNGDGSNDQVELSLPLNPADQATLSLLNQLGVTDSDNDGQVDAIRFENQIGDDKGHHSERDSEHRFRDGQTVVDDNSNGDFSDDSAFDDSDCDGVADDNGGSGGGNGSDDGLSENRGMGAVTRISPDRIFLGDSSWLLTSATRFLGQDNQPLTAADFTVGMNVEVEGLSDGNGGWTALKVKLEDGGGDDNGGDDNGHASTQGAITRLSVDRIFLGDSSYLLTADTVWLGNDNQPLTAADFGVGMTVEVESVSDGNGGQTAVKVKLEDAGGDDGNSGTGDELEKTGTIEALDGGVITVGGVGFKLTADTVWRIGNDEGASQSDFSVGMTVEVTGDSDGQGGWIARRVKTED